MHLHDPPFNYATFTDTTSELIATTAGAVGR